MAHLYEQVLTIITKPAVEREEKEINRIVYWFRKKSEIFENLKEEIVKDILKNCQFTSCVFDDVVIRQGELGDCFYVILSGSVKIYIDTNLSEEDYEEIRRIKPPQEELREVFSDDKLRPRLDRSKYGNYIGKIGAGKSFGELALIRADSVRNATIIADEPTDVLVVNRDLYNRSLHAYQKQEFETKKSFVDNYLLFRNWQPKYKKMMAMSLVKRNLKFEDVVFKQAQPVEGLYFIISGQVKIVIDVCQHPTQFSDLFPTTNVANLEKLKANDILRKEMNLGITKTVDKKMMFQRIKTPHHDGKKDSLRQMELCVVAAIDILGDIEMVLGLSTYAQTVVCTQEAEIYFLDLKNYDRLIEKRNPQAIDLMRNLLHTKLTVHFLRLSEDKLPLFRFFLFMLDEKERTNKQRDIYLNQKQVETNPNSIDNLQKGPLVNLFGPGSVFYVIRQRENKKKKRALRALQFRTQRIPVSSQVLSATGLSTKPEDVAERPTSPKEKEIAVPSLYALNIKSIEMLTSRTYLDSSVDLHKKESNVLTLMDQGDVRVRQKSLVSYEDKPDLEGFDEVDWTVGDKALSKLENRIQAWHSSLDCIDGRQSFERMANNLVKLHRYQPENETFKPKPGNKVFLRLKEQAKTVPSPETDRSNKTTCSRTLVSSAGVCVEIVTNQPSDEDTETESTKKPRSRQSKRSKSQQSNRFTFAVKKSSGRQYTVEEYQALKEELRRRQRAYKSFLPMRSSAVML